MANRRTESQRDFRHSALGFSPTRRLSQAHIRATSLVPTL